MTIQIPDELASHLPVEPAALSRRVVEAIALDEFKTGRISKFELRQLLGFGTRYKLDEFLKSHNVFEDYTMEDFEQEREDLRRLGF